MTKLKYLLIALLTSAIALQGEETEPAKERVEQSYGYFSIGSGYPSFFTLNYGKRVQRHYHGLEGGIGATNFFLVTEGHAYANYLLFPKPNLNSQFYFGAGGQVGLAVFYFFSLQVIPYFQPQFLVGYEHLTANENRWFVQLAAGGPYFLGSEHYYYPNLSISYGFKF